MSRLVFLNEVRLFGDARMPGELFDPNRDGQLIQQIRSGGGYLCDESRTDVAAARERVNEIRRRGGSSSDSASIVLLSAILARDETLGGNIRDVAPSIEPDPTGATDHAAIQAIVDQGFIARLSPGTFIVKDHIVSPRMDRASSVPRARPR